ncbi:Coenzyme F420 hydrogenase/dehydrogenase, beta subunit C-terminal domain [Candidatus Poriferisodalis sp.]|uniref:Coenzyme F420 hydrogenase/dehydrogenase, beta subunit C-terminal domain n=1 Tax=Candidatus Poriferisodalis sp. TaxID=3101277 RepID=UPI003B515E26
MTNDTAQPITTNSIAEIVANDLCIGCGLCEALTGGRVTMVMTPAGSLRPSSTDAFTNREEAQLMAACPGAVAEARTEDGTTTDPVWGAHRWMSYAWADQPDTRFRAATGGALTALGAHALNTGRAEFVLHVGADPERPMRSRWVLSEDADSVRANTSSRYGPTAPLAGLAAALERRRPFAIIAKPCDLGAVHTLSKSDPRVDELCVIRLALVCGGQSRLSKSQAVLHELGIDESEVTLFRYRGHGNPGPTVIETAAGDRYAKTYLDMWEDESGWEVETRCKLCPDALGEASDVASADVWPGGAPTGEDEGFNGIIVRTAVGEDLVGSAVASSDLVLGDPITPRQFDNLQPHQVRKKEALAARYQGLSDAGISPIETHGLRIAELGRRMDPERFEQQRSGAQQRIEAARSRQLPD